MDKDITKKSEGTPTLEEGCSQEKKNKKAVIHTLKSQVGTKELTSSLVFESGVVPERGSAEMYDAIFKAAKKCGSLTTEDKIKVDKDIQKFWGKPIKSREKQNKVKVTKVSAGVTIGHLSHSTSHSTTTKNPKMAKPLSALDPSLTFRDAETINLLKECEELLGDLGEPMSLSLPSTSKNGRESRAEKTPVENVYRNRKPPARTNLKTSGTASATVTSSSTTSSTSPLPISSDEEDIVNNSDDSVGEEINFYVIFKDKRYPMYAYRNQKVEDVRNSFVEKLKDETYNPELIHLFLGSDKKLANKLSVKDSGIRDFCDVDAVFVQKKERNNLKAKSSALRFKLQTGDRTGRQTIYIHAEKDSKMQSILEDYANRMSMDATTLKLMFDGDVLPLENTPEECELEGGECIDVVVK